MNRKQYGKMLLEGTALWIHGELKVELKAIQEARPDLMPVCEGEVCSGATITMMGFSKANRLVLPTTRIYCHEGKITWNYNVVVSLDNHRYGCDEHAAYADVSEVGFAQMHGTIQHGTLT